MNKIGPAWQSERARVVALGGGKGGSGRSSLGADLARSLSRHKQTVLFVEASRHVPCVFAQFGVAEPPGVERSGQVPLCEASGHLADHIVESGHEGLWLASVASARAQPFGRGRLQAEDLISQTHQLAFDWIILDLPTEADVYYTSLFALSDVPVLVTTPEAAALRATTQYLRAVIYQALVYHERALSVRESLVAMLQAQPMALTRDSLMGHALGTPLEVVVAQTLERLEPYVIVNMVREGAEHDLGHALCHGWHAELGVYARCLGSLDYDERRWFFQRRPGSHAPGQHAEEDGFKEMEGVSRSVLEIAGVDARHPRPLPAPEQRLAAHQVGLGPQSPANDVRQYIRRLWEGYRRESALSVIFADPAKRQGCIQALEELYKQVAQTGSDSGARAELEAAMAENASRTAPVRSIPGRPAVARSGSWRAAANAAANTPTAPSAPRPAPAVKGHGSALTAGATWAAIVRKPGERHPGLTLEELRRQSRMSLQELSLRTHIGVKYLIAMEDCDTAVLPREVYLRGYLREIARVLGADPEPLIEEYFRYLAGS